MKANVEIPGANDTTHPLLDRSEAGTELATYLRSLVSPATKVLTAEPLSRRTTLRVGGPAEVLVEPSSIEDLQAVLNGCAERNIPWFLLGRGSNLLVRDGGIRGVVLTLGQPCFSWIEVEGTRIQAGAGARLKEISNTARRAGIAGLEFLEGIPGSLGGALRMNAGAMGIATFDVVETLHMITPTGARLKARRDDVAVQYRSCPILHQNIAVGATLAGQAADPAEVKIRMDQYSKKRWESQPAQPSAGCIFKNPLPSMPAGKLIDELGLKGSKVGRAMVSDVHANFIVNLGGASAKEVLELIGLVREKAYRERGLQLLMEVEIVGEELQ